MDDINGYLLIYKPFTQYVTSTIRLLGWALLGSINIFDDVFSIGIGLERVGVAGRVR